MSVFRESSRSKSKEDDRFMAPGEPGDLVVGLVRGYIGAGGQFVLDDFDFGGFRSSSATPNSDDGPGRSWRR